MEKTTAKTKHFPLLLIHPILFLLFFLLKVYNNYDGLVDAKWALATGWRLLLIIGLFFVVSLLLFRDLGKAVIFCTVLEVLYLFFRSYKDFFKSIQHWLGKYSVLLPLMCVFVFFLFLLLKKTKHITKINLFLTILVLLYLGIEIFTLNFHPGKQHNSLFNPVTLHANPRHVDKPSIFYIVLDGYPAPDETGSQAPNIYSSLSHFFFFPVIHSQSNYNATAFSTAATLNLQYISNYDSSLGKSPSSYLKAMNDIKNSNVVNFLKTQGYAIVNLSIFDLQHENSIEKEHFIKVPPADAFYYPTLWYAMRGDLLWNVYDLTHKPEDQKKAGIQVEKKLHEGKLIYNERVLDSLQNISFEDNKPGFVYAHLYMPHYPYFFDSLGKRYPDELAYERNIYRTDRFLNYVSYTEKRIMPVIENIYRHANGKAVIIVQSDHGYPGLSNNSNREFKNICALYFPDLNYGKLNDSMSNVNTFRVILNKYFNLGLPLLKDTSLFIRN